MTDETAKVEELVHKDYEHGFVTDIDADTVAPGLNEDVIALISARRKNPNGCWNGVSRLLNTGRA